MVKVSEPTEREVAAAEAAFYGKHERGFINRPLISAGNMRAALSAAARVRAEDNAETLIDTVSEEVWNHDASQDNCNVIDKDDLTNTGEAVVVSVADIEAWRAEWMDANDPQDGTDCVTPFDKYLYTRPSERTVTEAEIQRLTTEIARKHGCDRGTFTVCWGKVEKGLSCRCEDEARHALTALGAQTPPEGVVTDAMVEVAAKAVVAEWQKMVAETSPHMSPGDHARAFVSPGNYRLIRAALKAAMEAGR